MNTQKYPTWLVPIKIAKELKEIGFNEHCPFSMDNYWSFVDCSKDGNGFFDLEGKTITYIKMYIVFPSGSKPSLGSEQKAITATLKPPAKALQPIFTSHS